MTFLAMCTILCEESCLYELHMEGEINAEDTGLRNALLFDEGKFFLDFLIHFYCRM